ncbi:MAG: trypsin-like peptidase domain-containing protein [Isosphaeraceae bacterium]|nr:trypsin-like peptidase domain-containing protein [Isosphaeraceae bacterium]
MTHLPRSRFLIPTSVALLGATISAAVAQEANPKDEEAGVRESVVKIYSTTRLPEPMRPWQKAGPQEASGTGVVIDGKRILTNAHVVLYSSQLFVQPNGSGDKLPAKVKAIAPEVDLAILTLDDESFFEKRLPLPRAERLPAIKANVLVYGYPTGGSSLSLTKGIVSRIEFAPLGAGGAGLRIQIDAAINPGNSGGPVLVDGKMIGLAFSRLGGGDNIGYIIPTEEIDLFLQDVADGTYQGKPMIFDSMQTFENPALQVKLGVKKATGMIVTEPFESTPDYPLKKWDIVTQVGDREIDNVGMVQLEGDLRVRFQYLVQKLAKNGKLPLTIVREGKTSKIELPVGNDHGDLIRSLRGGYPPYFIYGPIVFSKATAEYMSLIERNPGLLTVFSFIGSPLVTRRGDRRAVGDEELVIVSSPMFPHRIAKGYSPPLAKVVKSVNGTRIKNLRHLVETLRDLKDRFVLIDFDDRNSETIVFDRNEVLEATEEILSDNSVRRQYSEEFDAIWKK